jgi:hypothetical protein
MPLFLSLGFSCQAEDLVFNQVLLYSVPGEITTILSNDIDLWISINNGPPVRRGVLVQIIMVRVV